MTIKSIINGLSIKEYTKGYLIETIKGINQGRRKGYEIKDNTGTALGVVAALYGENIINEEETRLLREIIWRVAYKK